MERQTDVLIVGAGPTGLSLAAQLLRFGIDFVLVDKKTGPTDLSRAVVVQARTLEIYDQIGLAHTAVRDGALGKTFVLMQDGETSARLDFSEIGDGLSPFPFALLYEQSKNEHLLYQHLQNAGQSARWQTELETLTQDADSVTATIQSADGQTETVRAKYLVGCDGASSRTRHLLNLGFEGATFARLFYVADVALGFDRPHDAMYAAFGADAIALLFPLQGDGHWRLIGNVPEYQDTDAQAADTKPDVPFEDAARKAEAIFQRPLDVKQVRWYSTYKVHTRHAETFAEGRCFLAGDAAHVHTPVGGQGMNTGIQDVYNLAWKLTWVLKGDADARLLDTYSEERLANAEHLLKTTDQLFDFAADDHWYYRVFRTKVLPNLANVVWRFEAARQLVFTFVSDIGISYRDASLSQPRGESGFKVKAGDRVPYFTVDGKSVYDLLRAPRFHLLMFGEGAAAVSPPPALAEQVEVHVLPLSPEAQEHFGTSRPFSVLLRPDLHVAFLAHDVTPDTLAAYFLEHLASRS